MDDRTLGWRGLLLVFGGILALAGLALGLWILLDDRAAGNVAAIFYDLIGDTTQANALRVGGGDRFLAKLIVAGVALAVGVGGIWLFYAGVNRIVEIVAPRRQASILPWVFVGPALVLLGIYLVWPVVSTIIKSFTTGGGLKNYEWALG